jgi:tape measure domain-containing protein
MTTETIDIIVRENGARVVKRSLEEIGDVATRSVRGLRLLQNSLFVLGGAGAVAGLTKMLDTLTNFENRLRLVTNSTAELNAVQNELFNIANRTRSSFETTSELYTRMALAARELGLSQRDVLQFTESLNQATILSGASTREANAALIQLSQGLASGRLNGDELRSVLEQLPYVADIIANSLGVTRGQLRKLGSDGKITSAQIVKAFADAREELAVRFGTTVPTIGQAFEVLRNQALRVVDQFDDMTGASASVANAIITIADSLEFLVAGIVSASAAFAAFKAVGYISALIQVIKYNREVAAAVAAGNATLLTAEGIEKAKAASALASAAATNAAATAKVRELQVGAAQIAQNITLLQQQAAEGAIVVTNGRARSALTGRFVALNAAVANNIRTNIALARTEQLLVGTSAELAAATTAQTAATNALSAAQARSTAAIAASSGVFARLSATFPVLAGLINIVRTAMMGLWAIMVANPIGAVIAAIVAIVAALVYFSDKIGVADDGFVTLRDVGIATFQLIGEAIAPVITLISDGFSAAIDFVSGLWNKLKDFVGQVMGIILNVVKSYINFQIGLWVGLFNSVMKAWGLFPAALKDLGALAITGLITVVEAGLEGLVKGIGDFLEWLGGAFTAVGLENPFATMFDNFDVNLEEFKPEVTGAAQQVGQIFNDEFGKALSTDYIGNAWGAILERARAVAAERLANLDTKSDPANPAGTGAGGADSKAKSFAEVVRELTLQNELLKVNTAEREKLQAVLQIEEQMKRSLTEAERGLVMELLNENQILKAASDIYEEINGPMEKYKTNLEAIKRLLADGRISQDQFVTATRAARIEFLSSQTDMASGLERGLLRILEKTGDYAKQMEDIITNAFDGMASAIADLVVDGEADFSSLIKSINKQIVQLVVSQAFQQLFGGFTGGTGTGGGNIFGNLFKSLFSSLPGLVSGGSFQVGSQSGIAPLPGVDNRLVAFRGKDGENVTVTPKGQTPGGGQQNITVNFNVSTPDVEGFRRSEGQLSARAARMISRAGRNS